MGKECGKCENSKKQNLNKEQNKTKEVTNKDFDKIYEKGVPNWNAVWNLLLQPDKHKKGDIPLYRQLEENDLKKKMKKKVSELVREEELLINLYEKARKLARKREVELNLKKSILLQQLEKDKNLLKFLKESF